jgi:hypothetical protein
VSVASVTVTPFQTASKSSSFEAVGRLARGAHAARVIRLLHERMRGEALAAHGEGADAVEAALARALETAGSHGARALELRAATTLARHLARRHRRADARRVLAPRYEMFTEGLDTADLRAANELLAALGA